MPRVGLLASGDGWHLRALSAALARLGCEAVRLRPERLSGRIGLPPAAGLRPAAGRPPDGRASPGDAGGRQGAIVSGAEGRPIERLDGVLVRFIPPGSLDQIVFRMDCLHLLADGGLPVVNPPRAIERTVDKHWTSRLLADAGVPTPRTVAAQGVDEAMAAFRTLEDVVVKPLFGSGGRGIFRVSNEDLAERAFRALASRGSVLYLQEFVPHGHSDLRLFAAGGRVVAAARRVADGWKTNVAAGAMARAHRPALEEEELAVRACRAVGADYAGVDLIEAEDGRRLVVEVNGIPGWRALQSTTEIDLATEVAGLVAARLAVPHAAASRA